MSQVHLANRTGLGAREIVALVGMERLNSRSVVYRDLGDQFRMADDPGFSADRVKVLVAISSATTKKQSVF